MPCSAAISSSRSPNAPLAITSIFFPGGTTDEIDISIAAVPEPVMSSISCAGEAPNTGRSFSCSRSTTAE